MIIARTNCAAPTKQSEPMSNWLATAISRDLLCVDRHLSLFYLYVSRGVRLARAHLNAAEPPLRQIIDVLRQVMCTPDAEKLAISVLEIHEGGYHEERSSKW
jgi:hypothetical protein